MWVFVAGPGSKCGEKPHASQHQANVGLPEPPWTSAVNVTGEPARPVEGPVSETMRVLLTLKGPCETVTEPGVTPTR